jgi:acyl carrier protein
MTQDEVIAQLRNIMTERLRIPAERAQAVAPDAFLLKDGFGLDSLDCIELLLGIEEEFALSFDEGEEEWMHHFSTLESLAQLVLTAKGESV